MLFTVYMGITRRQAYCLDVVSSILWTFSLVADMPLLNVIILHYRVIIASLSVLNTSCTSIRYTRARNAMFCHATSHLDSFSCFIPGVSFFKRLTLL